MEIWSLIGKAVISIGGLGVIIAGIAKWLGQRWAERLSLSWKNEYDRELEKLRANLSTTQELLRSTIASVSQSSLAAQERRLKAVEELWMGILDIRKTVSPFLFIVTHFFEPETIRGQGDNPEFSSLIPEPSLGKLSDKVDNVSNSIERFRPFLGEKLWVLFTVYTAVVVRIYGSLIRETKFENLHSGYTGEESGLHGSRDKFMFNMLKEVLSNEEIEAIIKKPKFRIPAEVMNLLVQKILIETNYWISGSSLAEISLSEGMKLSKMLDDANILRNETKKLGKEAE